MCIFDAAELKVKLRHQSGATCQVRRDPWSTGNSHPVIRSCSEMPSALAQAGHNQIWPPLLIFESMRSISGSTFRQNSANVLSHD